MKREADVMIKLSGAVDKTYGRSCWCWVICYIFCKVVWDAIYHKMHRQIYSSKLCAGIF